MFNNEHYDKTEELADRIERMIERPTFHICYIVNPEMLVVYTAYYLDKHFRTEEEFGDGYMQAVEDAINLIYSRTHINETEAKVLATFITDEIIKRYKSMKAAKAFEEMKWNSQKSV